MMANTRYSSSNTAKGFIGTPPTKDTYSYMMIDDRVEEVRQVVVHKFTIGEVDDPDLYAGQPLWEWENSEAGQWVKQHAIETPIWHRQKHSHLFWGYEYCITAKFAGARLTEFLLRQNT
jgi:hypothetical protein